MGGKGSNDAPVSGSRVHEASSAQEDVSFTLPPPELTFLVTHWLRNLGSGNANIDATTSVSTVVSSAVPSPSSPIHMQDSCRVKDEFANVRRLTQELSRALASLGAYGPALRNPTGYVGMSQPSSYDSNESPSLALRNAEYEDVAARWSSVAPTHLETLLHGTKDATTSTLHVVEQSIRSHDPVVTSILKRAAEDKGLKLSLAGGGVGTGEENEGVGGAVVSLLQRQAHFSTPFQEAKLSASAAVKVTDSSSCFANEDGLGPGDISQKIPTTSTFEEASYPNLILSNACKSSRNRFDLRLAQQQSKKILTRLKRDLSRHSGAGGLMTCSLQATPEERMDKERVVAHLSRSVVDAASRLDKHQSEANAASQEARMWSHALVKVRENYRNPYSCLPVCVTGATRLPVRGGIGSPHVLSLSAPFSATNVFLSNLATRTVSNRTKIVSQKKTILALRKARLLRQMSHVVTVNSHLFYPVYCLRFDRTGKFFVSGADDHLAKLFYLGDAASFASDGYRCSSIGAGSNSRGATLVCTFRGHRGVITDIDVSMDNALVATGSEDGDCRIWGLRDGSPVAVLRGHVGGVTMVSFSLVTPFCLVTTAEDGLARMWDVREASLMRYVNIIGGRLDYCSPRASEPSREPHDGMVPPAHMLNDGNANADETDAGNDDDDDGDEDGNNSDLPLPPIPVRNSSAVGATIGGSNARIPVLRQVAPGALEVRPLPAVAGGGVGPNGNANANDGGAIGNAETLDEGVHLIAKLQHGETASGTASEQQINQPTQNVGGPVGRGGARGMATRNRRHAVKVICMTRCPLGGHFATGSDDGVGRMWSDYQEEVYEPDEKKAKLVEGNCTASPKKKPGRYSHNPSSRSIATLPGHLNAITDIQYSNSGDRLLTASQKDGVVRIWSWTKEQLPNKIVGLRQLLIRLAPISGTQSAVLESAGSNVGGRSTRGGRRVTGRSNISSRNSRTGTVAEVFCDVAKWSSDDLTLLTSQSQQSNIKARSTDGNSGLTDGNQSEIVPASQVIRVWDSFNGTCLLSIAGAHNGPCTVIISHPLDSSIFVTAGSDGCCHLWDVDTGQKHFSYHNKLLYGAMMETGGVSPKGKSCSYLDGEWTPDGIGVVLTDDCGRVLVFDALAPSSNGPESQAFFGSDIFSASLIIDPGAPTWMREQYFASDYYELEYDRHGYAIDKRSNLPPHLSPRAVRCNHTGAAIADAIDYTLLQLQGPIPLPEPHCRDARRDVRRRALEVRSKRRLFDRDHLSNRRVAAPVHGGIVIRCFNGISTSPDGVGNAGQQRTQSGRSAGVRRAPRQLSSRYNWVNAYDEAPDDDDDDNDNDEEYVEPEARSGGRRLVDGNELNVSSHGSTDLSDSDDVGGLSSENDEVAEGYQLRSRPSRPTQQRGGQGQRLGGRRRRRNTLGISTRRQRREQSGEITSAQDTAQQEIRHQPSRISERQEARPRRTYNESDSCDSDLEEVISSNRRPADGDGYNGQYYEDILRGHFWKLPRGAAVRRAWLSRLESASGRTGQKIYAPQVGDTVVYIPRAHYDTIRGFPEAEHDSAPWKTFPTNSAWPVVLCNVKNVRYRFPIETLFREGARSVVAIVSLEVIGIPKIRSGGGLPWPMPEFILQRSRQDFEVSVFQSGEVDFLVPENIFFQRQRGLEAAIREKGGNPAGIELVAFYAPEEAGGVGEIDDAPLTSHPCEIVSVDGIGVGPEGIHSIALSEERELHFQQSGYNSIKVVWEDGSDGRVCPWEVNVSNSSIPTPATRISEEDKTMILDVLAECAEDPQIKNWFLHPVNVSRYSDYPWIIEVPLDLSVIRSRVQNNYYSSFFSVLADVRLIEENCCKYNEEGAEIVQVAKELYISFEGSMKEILQNSPTGLTDANPGDTFDGQRVTSATTDGESSPELQAMRFSRTRQVTPSCAESGEQTESRVKPQYSLSAPSSLESLPGADEPQPGASSLSDEPDSSSNDDDKEPSKLRRSSRRAAALQEEQLNAREEVPVMQASSIRRSKRIAGCDDSSLQQGTEDEIDEVEEVASRETQRHNDSLSECSWVQPTRAKDEQNSIDRSHTSVCARVTRGNVGRNTGAFAGEGAPTFGESENFETGQQPPSPEQTNSSQFARARKRKVGRRRNNRSEESSNNEKETSKLTSKRKTRSHEDPALGTRALRKSIRRNYAEDENSDSQSEKEETHGKRGQFRLRQSSECFSTSDDAENEVEPARKRKKAAHEELKSNKLRKSTRKSTRKSPAERWNYESESSSEEGDIQVRRSTRNVAEPTNSDDDESDASRAETKRRAAKCNQKDREYPARDRNLRSKRKRYAESLKSENEESRGEGDIQLRRSTRKTAGHCNSGEDESDVSHRETNRPARKRGQIAHEDLARERNLRRSTRKNYSENMNSENEESSGEEGYLQRGRSTKKFAEPCNPSKDESDVSRPETRRPTRGRNQRGHELPISDRSLRRNTRKSYAEDQTSENEQSRGERDFQMGKRTGEWTEHRSSSDDKSDTPRAETNRIAYKRDNAAHEDSTTGRTLRKGARKRYNEESVQSSDDQDIIDVGRRTRSFVENKNLRLDDSGNADIEGNQLPIKGVQTHREQKEGIRNFRKNAKKSYAEVGSSDFESDNEQSAEERKYPGRRRDQRNKTGTKTGKRLAERKKTPLADHAHLTRNLRRRTRKRYTEDGSSGCESQNEQNSGENYTHDDESKAYTSEEDRSEGRQPNAAISQRRGSGRSRRRRPGAEAIYESEGSEEVQHDVLSEDEEQVGRKDSEFLPRVSTRSVSKDSSYRTRRSRRSNVEFRGVDAENEMSPDEHLSSDNAYEAVELQKATTASTRRSTRLRGVSSRAPSEDNSSEDEGDSSDKSGCIVRSGQSSRRGGYQRGLNNQDDGGTSYPNIPAWPDIAPRTTMVQVARKILKHVEGLDVDGLFARPVVESFPAVRDDYLNIVSRPMDFKTIKSNLRHYESMSDLQSDIILVFRNCCDYNGVNVAYGKYALRLWNQLTDIFREICEEEGISSDLCDV